MTIDVINQVIFLMLKVTLVVIPVVTVIERSRSTSAAGLHRVLLVSFISLLIIPLAGWLLPAIPVGILTGPYAQILTWPWQASAASEQILWLLIAIYISGCLYKLFNFLGSLWQLQHLANSATPCPLASVHEACELSCKQWQIKRPVRCVMHKAVTVPMTWGTLRPVIAVPETIAQWDAKKILRIFLHETAHIKRNDALVGYFIAVVDAFLWCVPTKNLLLKKIHWYRELACDDMVLSSGVHRTDYAEDLMTFAHHQHKVNAQAVALMTVSDHYNRIQTILDVARVQGDSNAHWRLASLVIVALFAFIGAVSLQPQKQLQFTRIIIIPAPTEVAENEGQPLDAGQSQYSALIKPVGQELPPLVKPQVNFEHELGVQTQGKPIIYFEHPSAPQHITVEAQPEIIAAAQPQYPKRALQKGYEGKVEVTFDILASGEVSNVRLTTPHKSKDLNNAALEAAKKFQFYPRIAGGKAVATYNYKEVFQFQIIEDAN